MPIALPRLLGLRPTLLCAKQFHHNQYCNRLIYSSYLHAWSRTYGYRALCPFHYPYSDNSPGLRLSRLGLHPLPNGKPMKPERARLWLKITSKIITKLVSKGVLTHPIVNGVYREFHGPDIHQKIDAPEFLELVQSHRVVAVYGWQISCPALVAPYADEIRQKLRPNLETEQTVTEFLAPLRQKCDVLIGVHMRRGDYARYRGGRYMFDDAVYQAAVEQLKQSLTGKRVGVVFCSNEPLSEQLLADEHQTSGPGDTTGDLCALSQCDHILGPPSSFSFWASFIGKKPLTWIRDASPRLDTIDPKEVECLNLREMQRD